MELAYQENTDLVIREAGDLGHSMRIFMGSSQLAHKNTDHCHTMSQPTKERSVDRGEHYIPTGSILPGQHDEEMRFLLPSISMFALRR